MGVTTTSLNNKNKKMSWQSYVDDQLLATKMVSQAAICGHDGNVWATSAGFGVTAPELKHIATNFGNMSVMPMSGITVGGTKYMFLSANDKVMRGKKGACGGRTVCNCHREAGRIPGGSWILEQGLKLDTL